LLLLAALCGCKPGVGSSCDKGEARCIDHERSLACESGKFIETPCRGPKGCATSEQGTSCDISGNRAGDACTRDDEGAAACSAKDMMLACRDGKYAAVPCRGARGCASESGRALCDTSIAAPSDACKEEGLKACSTAKDQVLICKDHGMVQLFPCRGENGCSSGGGKLSCDTSIAKLADPCDKKMDGQAFSCTPDATAILTCKAGLFTLDEKCKAGQKCVVDGSATQCKKQ
jgi:hypothetical protein